MPHENRILIVDDDRIVRLMLEKMIIKNGFPCATEPDGESALRRLEHEKFDLMLCDMNMTGMTGIDLITQVTEKHKDMASIMVTSMDDPELAQAAMQVGAYGYLIKPMRENELLINIYNALQRRTLEIERRTYMDRLEHMVQDRTKELTVALDKLKLADGELRYAHEETINRLMRVAEFRDNETGKHVARMSLFTQLLAQLAEMPNEIISLIRPASAMHDIGKVGIPDHILLKPGRLTPEEMVVMKTHAEIGYQILMGSRVPLLDMAATIARNHHEKWDGTGYPQGLKGEKIPLEARMTSISDVFDALTSKRPYKPAHSVYDASQFMRSQSGTHFDPKLLDLFLKNVDVVMAIKAKYPD